MDSGCGRAPGDCGRNGCRLEYVRLPDPVGQPSDRTPQLPLRRIDQLTHEMATRTERHLRAGQFTHETQRGPFEFSARRKRESR